MSHCYATKDEQEKNGTKKREFRLSDRLQKEIKQEKKNYSYATSYQRYVIIFSLLFHNLFI